MPEPVEEPHLSWSQLQTLSDCGVKYELTYVQKVPRAPQGPLIAGRAIHAAIEWAETPQPELEGWCPIQDLTHGTDGEFVDFLDSLRTTFRRLFDENMEEEGGADVIRWAGRKLIHTSVEYKRFVEHIKDHKPLSRPGGGFIPFKFRNADPETAAELNHLWAADDIPRLVKILNTGSEDDRWWRKMGPVFLRRYCDLRVQDESSGVKLWDSHVERVIDAKLPSGTTLRTRVDSIVTVTGDGEVGVRDPKSGKVGGGQPMQLGIYGWAIGQALGVTPSFGEFIYLRADSPAKMVQRIDGERFARLVALVPDVMARHEAQAAAGVYPFNPGFMCGSCQVKAFCAYGRELPDD